jgi:hypothetical protein
MSTLLNEAFRQVLEDSTARALLVTLDEQGVPHVEEKHSIGIDAEGRILLPEEGEYSLTNLNLVRSLWFDHKAVLYLSDAERRFDVTLRPYKVHISGSLFEAYYHRALEQPNSQGLSGVWVLIPEKVTEETPDVRIRRENENRLPLTHLDRIAKKSEPASN